MTIEQIKTKIENKYNKLLLDIERNNEFVFTNKLNGLVVKITILGASFSKEESFIHHGQDFFKVNSIKDAVDLLKNLGFEKEQTEKILNSAFYKSHKCSYNDLDFFLGFYILEAVSLQ